VCWRNPPPSPAKHEAVEFAKKAQNARSVAESVTSQVRLQAPPAVSVTQLAALQQSAILDGNTTVILDLAAALASSLKQAPTSSPPSARSSKRKARALWCSAKAANAIP